MKKSVLGIVTFILISVNSIAQNTVEDQIKQLSKDKWQWMADKDVE